MPLVDLPSAPPRAIPLQPQRQSGWSQKRRAVVMILLFLSGLFGTAALVGYRMPFPDVPIVTRKVDWLAQHGEEYDTFFVGSSRTFYHIIPRLFDQLMAEAGMPTHSFNLGIPAMRPPEDTYLLKTVFKQRKAPLKLVVMEVNSIDVSTPRDENSGSARFVYWHDYKSFFSVIHCILQEGPPKSNKHYKGAWKSTFWKLEAIGYNLNLCFSKILQTGRGFDLWDQLCGKSREVASAPYDGYERYGTPLFQISQSEWELMQSRMKMFPANFARVKERNVSSQIELQEKRRLVEAHGGEAVSFIGPIPSGAEYLPDPAMHPGLTIFDFANPELYPELFLRENRQDVGHLNQKGSEIFTRLLVEKIVAAQRASK